MIKSFRCEFCVSDMFLLMFLPFATVVSNVSAQAIPFNTSHHAFQPRFSPSPVLRIPDINRPFVRRPKPPFYLFGKHPYVQPSFSSDFPTWDEFPFPPFPRKQTGKYATSYANVSRGGKTGGLYSNSVQKRNLEREKTKVEIVKSIEMEYDPTLNQFVPKRESATGKHKKRSDQSTNQTPLLTSHTNKNLRDIFQKFQQEQVSPGPLRDVKNFQTGRFKSHYKVKSPENPKGSICDSKPSPAAKPRTNPEEYSDDAAGQHSEPVWSNNSLTVVDVNDPDYYLFWSGNWSRLPIHHADDYYYSG